MLHEMGYDTGVDLGAGGRGGEGGAGRARAPARQPRAHGRPGRVAARLALAVATGAASVLPGFLVGALALQIRSDLDVRVEAVAAGVSVFFLAGALGASWGGRLADHVGAVRAMRWCVLVTAACLLACALLAESLVVLLLLLAVAGVSNSVCQPAINLFVSEQVPGGPPGTRLRNQAVRHPRGDPRERPRPAGAGHPAGLAGHVRALRAGAAGGRGRAAPAGSVHVSRRPASRRPSRALVLTAIGAALATAGPSALGAYLVASAVDVGIARGHRGAAGGGQQRAEPRGARDARRASRPPARLRAQHGRRAAGGRARSASR